MGIFDIFTSLNQKISFICATLGKRDSFDAGYEYYIDNFKFSAYDYRVFDTKYDAHHANIWLNKYNCVYEWNYFGGSKWKITDMTAIHNITKLVDNEYKKASKVSKEQFLQFEQSQRNRIEQLNKMVSDEFNQ